MRLKSLVLKGFKSFANETVINFNEDVIGIVGPNGSGKSNIVDAIRWVLGEQKSKHLRLDKMTNVIFNGTKKRKPSGLASVTLTFENTKNILPTEYQTVSISRILYRSGESEYRLNNVPCRLKDITTLFLDTGIGSNSYAIIALGMVDDLLQDKDNSRRKMFEQAAGISKYKRRKHQTLNKLKSTTEDLDRIEDLLFEIDGNLKSLEKQARRTKRYYDLKAQYKEQSIAFASYKLSHFKDDHEELQTKLTNEEDSIRSIDAALITLEADLEAEKKANLDKEKLLSESQKAVNAKESEVQNLESDKRVMRQQMEYLETDKEKLAESVAQARVRIEDLKSQIQTYQQQLTDEQQKEEELKNVVDESKKNLDDIKSSHGQLQTELQQFVTDQQHLEKEVFELEKNNAISDSQIASLMTEMGQIDEQTEEKKNEIVSLQELITEKERHRTEQVAVLEELEQAETKRQATIMANETKMEGLRKNLGDISRELDAKRNEHKLTKSMVESLEGYPESIKFLSKSKEWLEQATLLSDVMYVDPEFRVTIENFLEPYLNYYVVNTFKDAKRGVELLGKSQKGKANFFILEAFTNYAEPAIETGGNMSAMEKVQVDPQYRKLISHLLGKVLIGDSEDLSDNLYQQSDTVVLSKSGSFIKRKYSLMGGSVGLFEGKKIGRKKNLEVLSGQIQKLEVEEESVNAEFFKIRGVIDELKKNIATDEIRQERGRLNLIEQELVSLNTKRENIDQFLRDNGSKRMKAEVSINRLQGMIAEIAGQLSSKQELYNLAKSKIQDKDQNFKKVAHELGEASNQFNSSNIEFIRQQNKVNAIRQELEFRENQNRELHEKIEREDKAIENAIALWDKLSADLKALELNLIKGYEERDNLTQSLTQAEQKYFKARGGITELEESLRSKTRKRTQVSEVVQKLKDKFNEMKLDLSSISERLKIEFGIEAEEVMKMEVDPEINPVELEEKVEKLKKRLDNYGEINPMAVEAFDEMKIRYDSITAQRDDILDAKKSLLDTITEIEDKATSQFLEAFEKARGYFIEVFRTLFTEDDQCDLILTEPDNPLESPINIIAKPKGKRPLTINQLSGGEKTLTATALLFALYLLKPAPFCVFDEVDAPLDDANIEKFNKIIRKFSEQSQFIIVTHNKATMSAVDVIYGVFMQEMGISDLNAVDFRELDNTATLMTA